VIQDRTSEYRRAFTEFTLRFFNVLKVALFTFYQVYDGFLSGKIWSR